MTPIRLLDRGVCRKKHSVDLFSCPNNSVTEDVTFVTEQVGCCPNSPVGERWGFALAYDVALLLRGNEGLREYILESFTFVLWNDRFASLPSEGTRDLANACLVGRRRTYVDGFRRKMNSI